MYKMVVEIRKETWGKCGLKTVKHYNEEKHLIELWQKMSDIEIQLGHSNIADVVLKRIRKYCAKRTKNITREEKEKYEAFFEGEENVFIFEKLARDIIGRCKLPKAIELRKKIGYNHDEIIVWEEVSIAEKIIKPFPNKNIVLNKIVNNRKPDILFKNHNRTIQIDEGNHEIMTQMTKKKEKTCLKDITSNIFDVIPMILILIFLNLQAK